MSIMEVMGPAALVALSVVTALWMASLILRDASIVDVFWGLGFVLLTWVYFVLTPDGSTSRKLLIGTLVTLWGLRLSIHILWRNWGKGEDFRYRKWRDAAGRSWWWKSYFKVFLLQGLLMWIISAPLAAAQVSPTPGSLALLDILSIPVWLVGFLFESVADWQLARFRGNPDNRGKLLREGLWRYSRHPNYFGDATQWWGYYLVAAAAGGYWTLFSPILMTYLLMRVSGVTMLEQTLKTHKPDYRDYIASTNAFLPWPPRILGSNHGKSFFSKKIRQ
jgi:steroid 5-alpha reductase family enzyme